MLLFVKTEIAFAASVIEKDFYFEDKMMKTLLYFKTRPEAGFVNTFMPSIPCGPACPGGPRSPCVLFLKNDNELSV